MLESSPSFVPDPANDRVYLGLYQLKEPPFTITPDPEYLYLSNTHQSALEKILYGIRTRLGFMMLTGEVGTGKTTLCRHILDTLGATIRTVYIINPSLSGTELLGSILDDLEIPYGAEASKKERIEQLNHFLLNCENDRPVVVIIDDAQTMPVETLEDLRLLSNLETDKIKLLQVLLVGQPELVEMIGKAELRQLRQRIALHSRLELLDRRDAEEYISRRLYASGNRGRLKFSSQAVALVHKQSGGIPRLMNRICDYALMAGYVDNLYTIGPDQVRRALKETAGLSIEAPLEPIGRSVLGKGMLFAAGTVLGLTFFYLLVIWGGFDTNALLIRMGSALVSILD